MRARGATGQVAGAATNTSSQLIAWIGLPNFACSLCPSSRMVAPYIRTESAPTGRAEHRDHMPITNLAGRSALCCEWIIAGPGRVQLLRTPYTFSTPHHSAMNNAIAAVARLTEGRNTRSSKPW